MPPIKPFMVGCLALMLVLAAFALGEPERILWGFLIVAFYAAFDLLWTFLKRKIWYFPTSSLISGLILGLIAAPAANAAYAAALAFLAVFGKQALHWNKGRHIFNPAAFSLGILYFFTPSISWWAPSLAGTNTLSLITLLLVGVFIVWKINKWRIVLPFLAVYALGLFSTQLFDGTLIFFMAVMLIEPVTSAFSSRKSAAAYGVLVGAFAVLLSYFTSLDPLIFGLLAGNFAAALLRL
ncbi:MAG: hypothetical protein HYW15_02395 [Candidatus Giovannonibacteria bacterium]|nr:MAG: hypothetical protein HYW15_02395 [Candidatus Giovannonibacteria bacterium]